MNAFDFPHNRRAWLRTSGASALACAIANAWMRAPALAQPVTDELPLNRFPRMVQEYYVEQVRRIGRQRRQKLNALRSKADAEAYVNSVRERILESFGPFPEKTPLNARVTGTVDRDTYHIENVLFESRPGFLVSANLYVPKGREFPLPGVVGSCGHSANGKAAEAYQSFAQGLARLGYVVLIFDPIGQGERFQYLDEDLESSVGAGVREHLLAGNQQFLVGEFIGSWRAWDGIRALDYLLTREEVDPNQVGVTGNSGGGTMTTWLCGVEQRWSMAAPSCFVTEFARNLENELPADTEQCPPKALALGLEHEDFLAAMAPKPVIILAKERDYFDVRGSEAAYRRLRRLYRLLGAEDNIGLFVGPTGHGYSQENREAMYQWFNRATGVSDARSEPDLTIEDDEVLWCAPDGQVGAIGSKTVMSFTQEPADSLVQARSQPSQDELPQVVAGFLKVELPDRPPRYRILRPMRGRDYPKPHATPYAVETEPGIQALVYRLADEAHLSRPPGDPARAILYVSHQSSDRELREDDWVRTLIDSEPDSVFYTCDVRGIGESRPDTCGTDAYRNPYGSDYFYAAHALMLDRPYPAQRALDLLSVLAWLNANGHREVHLAAKGWGTIPATFAALRSETVVQVTLQHALTSYLEVAQAERYDWPLSSMLPGVLAQFDLPECYAWLSDRKQLRVLEPWGPSYS